MTMQIFKEWHCLDRGGLNAPDSGSGPLGVREFKSAFLFEKKKRPWEKKNFFRENLSSCIVVHKVARSEWSFFWRLLRHSAQSKAL